jgi:flagellar M-ring protein FliF
MNNLLQQLTALWGRLQATQRITIILVVGGLIVALGAIVYGSSRPDYRLLARDLNRAQVAEIAGYLDNAKVAYQVADGESAILVPSKDLYRLRNDLAQRSMLGDGAHGFELLDGSSMWDSTFREHKTYDRAVSGELERSFREMPGVRMARVLIDRPAPSPFLGDADARPRASIKLDLQPGSRLTDRQVAGIIHLTSGAVAGLPPENVQVMDGNGLLTPKEDEHGVGMASTVLQAESERESYLTRKAQEVLDATLGRGRSQVKVAVKLDFSRRTEASTNPDKSVVLKEETTTEEENTPVFANAGVAGTASNVETAESGSTSQPSNAKRTNEEAKNEYVVGNRTITQEDEVGRTRAMTVSILVDQRSRSVDKLDDKGQPTGEKEVVWEPIPPAELEQMKELVLNAIGFYAAKGSQSGDSPQQLEDRFKATAQCIRMWREAEVDPAVAQAATSFSTEQLKSWISYAAAGVAALVFLLLARGQLKRTQAAWVSATAERTRSSGDRQTKEQEEEAAIDPQARRESLRGELAKRIQTDPALAASILRKWMHGDG